MDTKIKTQWVDALRSGKYKQGIESMKGAEYEYDLKTDSFTPTGAITYCCLGVLTDVLGKWDEYFKSGREFNEDAEEGDEVLPGQFAPVCTGLTEHECHRFAFMNDVENKTFDEIATYIEENY